MYKREPSANGVCPQVASCMITYSVDRLNTKLEANGYPTMTSLVKDLSDGVRLIQLMVSEEEACIACTNSPYYC
jgi:hypothetical protein